MKLQKDKSIKKDILLKSLSQISEIESLEIQSLNKELESKTVELEELSTNLLIAEKNEQCLKTRIDSLNTDKEYENKLIFEKEQYVLKCENDLQLCNSENLKLNEDLNELLVQTERLVAGNLDNKGNTTRYT